MEIIGAPFVAIGLELWENTGDNPKKVLDNYIIDLSVSRQQGPRKVDPSNFVSDAKFAI